MEKNYEVESDDWWGDLSEWRVGVWPISSGEVVIEGGKIVRLDFDREPAWQAEDRQLWWRHDADTDELVVRIPQSPDEQDYDEGMWIERRYFIDSEGTIRARPTAQLHSYDDDPMGYAMLTSIGLRDVTRQLRRHLLLVARRMQLGDEWDRATVKLQTEGRPRTDDALLAQWAERYVDALQADGRRPYAVLMEKYPYESDPTLRMRVRQARDRGLLTKVGRGQTGGALTPKAEQLLKGEI